MPDDQYDLALVAFDDLADRPFHVTGVKRPRIDFGQTRDWPRRIERAAKLRDIDGIEAGDDIDVGQHALQFKRALRPRSRQAGIVDRRLCLLGVPHKDQRGGRLRLEKPRKTDAGDDKQQYACEPVPTPAALSRLFFEFADGHPRSLLSLP